MAVHELGDLTPQPSGNEGKFAMRYYSVPTRRANVKKRRKWLGRVRRNRNSCALLVGTGNGVVNVYTKLAVLRS